MNEEEESESMSDRKFNVDFREAKDPDGRDDIELVVTEEVEVVVGIYETDTELQRDDAFLRTQENKYGGAQLVFRRQVPLSDDEQALVQAVYSKTKDFTW